MANSPAQGLKWPDGIVFKIPVFGRRNRFPLDSVPSGDLIARVQCIHKGGGRTAVAVVTKEYIYAMGRRWSYFHAQHDVSAACKVCGRRYRIDLNLLRHELARPRGRRIASVDVATVVGADPA